MDRHKYLLSGVLVITAVLTMLPATGALAVDHCETDGFFAGSCSSGHLTPGGAAVGATGVGSAGTGSSTGAWVPPPGWFLCNDQWRPPEERGTAICRDPITVTGPPVPTLNDVRKFFPIGIALTSEPAGWAVRGLPANFIAPVATHQSAGTVLGLPTEVQFAPVAVRWDYGDGTTASTTTGGTTWQRLGQRRFTETATSHIYRARGAHSVSATVEYSVTYRFGAGTWRPIEGILSIPLPQSTVRVVSGSTVLTDGPCASETAASC